MFSIIKAINKFIKKDNYFELENGIITDDKTLSIITNENIRDFQFFYTIKDLKLEDGSIIKKNTEFLIEGYSNKDCELHFSVNKDNHYKNAIGGGYIFPFSEIEKFAKPTNYSLRTYITKSLHDASLAEDIYILLSQESDEKYININSCLKKIYEKGYTDYNLYYDKENKSDIITSAILHELENSSRGYKYISWEMINHLGENEKYNFKAYNIDKETWDILILLNEDTIGNSEGYNFKFTIDPVIKNLHIPCCSCGDYEISDNFVIKDNMISSDCDTYASLIGYKAKVLYAFYITDLDKFAIVNCSYYLM